jgi:hypothetical protein
MAFRSAWACNCWHPTASRRCPASWSTCGTPPRTGATRGFPSSAAPGEVVAAGSVPRDVVADDETFLRGKQLTDERGLCVFFDDLPGLVSRSYGAHPRDRAPRRVALGREPALLS